MSPTDCDKQRKVDHSLECYNKKTKNRKIKKKHIHKDTKLVLAAFKVQLHTFSQVI